jgi:succinate-semialdehyde dehydrogenase/glutarate-semialdehyde dehydrogenase
MIASVNPATGEVMRTFEPLTDRQAGEKLGRAAAAFAAYRHTSFGERRGWMLRAAAILEAEKEAFGRIMTAEMGKTLASAAREAEKSAFACRYYAENAERLLADEKVDLGGDEAFITCQPLGVILAVMPWNFPFWQAFRYLAPALMAGNAGLLKHASNVPQCALAIEDIVRRAGFPQDVFQALLIGSAAVGRLIDDERVRAVTLTGSEPAGSQVASRAGKLIKKSVLELGGSDPFVVMPSADIEQAARTAVEARILNNGQSCIAAKRFIVHERVADEFERRFVAGMEALRVGDPMDPATEVGPLVNGEAVDTIEDQVRRSVEKGARVLTGGRRLDGPGNYFAPTVITGVSKGSPAYSEELFGPVAVLFRVKDIDEAIALANDTEFGLGASAWTGDEAERRRFIRDIESGMVFINAMTASDPRLPFGGVKHSGYGREMGANGIREFVNIKTVVVKGGARVAVGMPAPNEPRL